MTDCCQAAAQVSVVLASGRQLDFCKHHYDKHELALMVDEARVISDRRAELVATEKARRG